MIPFTTEQFLRVFESYNETIYPVQWILVLMAMAAVLLSLKPSVRATRIITVLLFALWCWSGVVYHWMFFSHINKAAYLFGLLFIIQAFLFLLLGFARGQPVFRARVSVAGVFGALLIIYALLIYPVLSYSFGHRYPQSPTFGVPCPTTILTFGLLLWLDHVPRFLMVIPLAWSLLGISAAASLAISEDIGLVLAGLIGTILILRRPLTLDSVETPIHRMRFKS